MPERGRGRGAMSRKERVDALGIAATMVGTIIGAGFATGQEILHFFARHGAAGFVGVALSTVLFCVSGVGFLRLSHRLGAGSYADIVRYVAGRWFGGAVDGIMTVFLLGIVGVMLAGAGAAFQALGWPPWAGVLATLTVGLAAVLAGLEGVMAVNVIVVPFMVLFSIGICIWSLTGHGLPSPVNAEALTAGQWIIPSVLYVSYNISLALPVIAPLGRASSRRNSLQGGVLAGLTLGVLVLAIDMTILAHQPDSLSSEVPMIFVAGRQGRLVQVLYGLVLWGEIMTTLVGNLFGVARRLARGSRISYPAAVIMATILALLISRAGFAKLVQTLYPFFGYVCLALVLLFGVVTCVERLRGMSPGTMRSGTARGLRDARKPRPINWTGD